MLRRLVLFIFIILTIMASSMRVNVLKEKNKVQDLRVQADLLKLEEVERKNLGEIFFLVVQTIEPEMTEEEFNVLLEDIGKNQNPTSGHEKTIVKGNTSFQLKVSTEAQMVLFVKNKNT